MGDRGGMSGILAQKYQDGWRPIYFGSRRLTDAESRWGQKELEARAVKCGAVEKFGKFLVGAPTFQIFTDAKSLVPLFNKVSRKAPPRIERQILGMKHFRLQTSFLYIAQVKKIQLILLKEPVRYRILLPRQS